MSVKTHLIMTVVWGIVLIAATIGAVIQAMGVKVNPFVWLLGVTFISLCSIYANMVGHWSAYQGSLSEEATKSE